jgi:hypothetical protein
VVPNWWMGFLWIIHAFFCMGVSASFFCNTKVDIIRFFRPAVYTYFTAHHSAAEISPSYFWETMDPFICHHPAFLRSL